MAEGREAADVELPAWPSVDDVEPEEEGGPVARTGFNYQDEIAVGFLLEMLEDPTLLKIHCETHDDVLLVRAPPTLPAPIAEFVQVKAREEDKLWSVPDICAPKKRGAVGTSIYETSLGRDKHQEAPRFRLVTLRPVVNELKLLTYPCGAPGREPHSDGFKALCSELEKRCPGFTSPRGNGAAFWLEHCRWDVCHDEQAVRHFNLRRIMRLGMAKGCPLLLEPAETLLDELRAKAKAAGDAKWKPDRDKKIITREALCAWWEQRTRELTEGAAATSGGKLVAKMQAAGLPGELIALAVELRRDYAATSRGSRYLELDEAERLRSRVRAEVISLRARFIAGQLPLDGISFHSLCLERMDAVNAERAPGAEDRSAFLKGCIYDITDRCQLRFEKPAP